MEVLNSRCKPRVLFYETLPGYERLNETEKIIFKMCFISLIQGLSKSTAFYASCFGISKRLFQEVMNKLVEVGFVDLDNKNVYDIKKKCYVNEYRIYRLSKIKFGFIMNNLNDSEHLDYYIGYFLKKVTVSKHRGGDP